MRRGAGYLDFEDGWDAAGYICLNLGIILMLLGTLAAPNVPALYLLGQYPDPIVIVPPNVCVTNDCTTAQCITALGKYPQCEDAPRSTCNVGLLDQCKGCYCVGEGVSGCACYAR